MADTVEVLHGNVVANIPAEQIGLGTEFGDVAHGFLGPGGDARAAIGKIRDDLHAARIAFPHEAAQLLDGLRRPGPAAETGVHAEKGEFLGGGVIVIPAAQGKERTSIHIENTLLHIRGKGRRHQGKDKDRNHHTTHGSSSSFGWTRVYGLEKEIPTPKATILSDPQFLNSSENRGRTWPDSV